MLFLSGDNAARKGLEHEYAAFAEQKSVYDQIRFIDLAGNEIIRVNYRKPTGAEIVLQDRLQTKAMRYYFQQALMLDRGQIFVSPFDLNVEHGQLQRPIKPVVRFLTPAFSDTGQKRGFVVLNYLGAHLIGQLKEISAGFRGETMLVNQSGEYLQAPNAGHEWGWMLSHDHSFRSHFPRAWKRLRYEQQGQFWIDDDLFTVQRVSPSHTSVPSTVPSTIAQQTPNSAPNRAPVPCCWFRTHPPRSSLHIPASYCNNC